jgi:hypothetical protein
MPTFSLKDARAGFSNLLDDASRGEFVTITRHGKPVAAPINFPAGCTAIGLSWSAAGEGSAQS